MPAPSRTTLLAILQQSEYDFTYFDRWYNTHPEVEKQIEPKTWTSKLKLIQFLSQLWGFLPTRTGLKLATSLTMPGEWLIRQSTYARARAKLQAAKKRGLKVIAFSGSYGKTSTKSIAAHVLGQTAPTLTTGRSINTPLGIAQIILTELKPDHQYFLVELGEYYPGDITELCHFIQPDFGIVTPLGRQHLERMGDLSTIAKTILELAQHLKTDQQVLVHESLQPFLTDWTQWQFYGTSPTSLWRLEAGKVTRAGTEGIAVSPDHSQRIFTPLFGAHQLVNALPSLWLSQKLGLDLDAAGKKLGSIPSVPHRHEPIFAENNVLILDNGYNSNPDSAETSLQLLKELPGSHKLVVTPGFVELGPTSPELHHQFGEQLAAVADYVVILDSPDSASLKQGWLQAGGKVDRIFQAKTQEAAVALLQPYLIADSILLFENNIPEVYG